MLACSCYVAYMICRINYMTGAIKCIIYSEQLSCSKEKEKI